MPPSLPTSSESAGEVLLAVLVLLPILGSVVLAFVKESLLARLTALGVCAVTLAICIGLVIRIVTGAPIDTAGSFNPLAASFPLVLPAPDWAMLGMGTVFSVSFQMDAISGWLALLTCTLMPIAMLASLTQTADHRGHRYLGWMLLLQGAILGAFLARDALLFYVFFELTLLPSFFLINGWGGPERRYAASKFFLFTFLGSVFMLVSILYAGFRAGTFEIAQLAASVQQSDVSEQFWVLAGLLAGLCVKVPLIPLHSWLPVTYTQAPTQLTAVLSGLMAKLGAYGLIRLAIPIGYLNTSQSGDVVAHMDLLHVMAILSCVAILYAGLVAWMQRDAKTLVAYSSVSHLAFCVLAMLSMSTMGLQTSVLYMINHGISTAAVFLVIGMIESRAGSRRLDVVGGLGRGRPWLSFFLVLFVMSSIGLPLTNGFISEFLSIQSALVAPHLGIGYALAAGGGILLGAIYMLHMVARLLFGPEKLPADAPAPRGDLKPVEIALLTPLALLVIVLGTQPQVVLDSLKPAVQVVQRPMPVVERGATTDAGPSSIPFPRTELTRAGTDSHSR